MDELDTYLQWKTQRANNPALSVVIPAYNEQERLIPTIGAMAAFVSDFGLPWELIVADDGSTDWTVPLVESLPLVNVRVLPAARNTGKGDAVRRGVLAAQGDFVLFADADNSTPIEELSSLLDAMLLDEFDIAVGSRAEAEVTGWCYLLSALLRFLVRRGLSLTIRDTQCGFKLFKREAAAAIVTQQTLTGFSFDLELLFLAQKYGFRVVEVPVDWVDSPGSRVDPTKEVILFLRDIVRIRLNDMRGVYRLQAA